MFLNIGILKKLMKQAYRTGLYVAATEDRYYIAGSYWEMDVKKEFLPKQIKAQLIELTGEIPADGERYKATKDGNQYEIEHSMEVNTEGCKQGIEVSKLILISGSTYQRMLQNESGKIYLINDVFVEIADNSAVEEDRGEYGVTTPLYTSTGLIWENNVIRFRAYWRTDEQHERLVAAMQGVDITEDPAE